MSYNHLNPRERMSLFYLHQSGLSLREIGRRLNRSHTTLSRELDRNQRRFGCYCDHFAQNMADNRKALPRHQRRYLNQKLFEYVITKIKARLVSRNYLSPYKTRLSLFQKDDESES